MAALKGNEYWKIRTKDGRDKKLTPEELLTKANEYFGWCLDNPLKEETIVKYKEDYELVGVSKMRPLTYEGMCNYIDIAVKTFNNYAHNKEYLPIVMRIRQIIYNQKFEGAASGFLNSNIIARDLGLKERTDFTSGDKSINAIFSSDILSADNSTQEDS